MNKTVTAAVVKYKDIDMNLRNRKKLSGKVDFFFTYIAVSERFVNMFNFIISNRRITEKMAKGVLRKIDRMVLWYLVYFNKYNDMDKALDASVSKIFSVIKLSPREKSYFNLHSN